MDINGISIVVNALYFINRRLSTIIDCTHRINDQIDRWGYR